MKRLATWVLLSMLVAAVNAAASSDGGAALQDGMINPGYHDKPEWFKQSFLDIRDDLAEAAAGGRRLLLYFYQDGCPYCAKLLNDNFGDRALADKTRRGFDVIAINLWGDRAVTGLDDTETSEKAFAAGLRVQYTPTLLFLDEAGGVVLRVNGYFAPRKLDIALDFVAGRHERQRSFRDYYAARAPAPASAVLNVLAGTLPEPLRLGDRGDSGRPLLVMFEQGKCRECDELHRETLSRSEVAYALTNLDVAQADLWSNDRVQTPDGREMVMRDWSPNSASSTPRVWCFLIRRAARCSAPRPICDHSMSMARSIMW